MAAPAGDYADGSVHTLMMGSEELLSMLGAAAERQQLVVVDFSASWCGPCKMMVPVLQRLAVAHRGRVVFVKVDCEETAQNRRLAQEAGISAFPTFHVYRSRQRVAEFRGANQLLLQQAITEQLALLGAGAPAVAPGQPAVAGAGAGPSAAPAAAAAGPMAAALAQALGRMRSSCPFDDFVAAARTLLTFVSNVLAHPGEPKYRRIRLSNAAFHSKLGSKPGGKECMAALGFQEQQEGGEGVLVLEEVPPELPQVKALLEQAIPSQGAGASAGGAPPPAPAPAAAQAAAGRPAGAPGGSSGGGEVDAAALAQALAAALGSAGAGPVGPQGGRGGQGARQQAAGPAGGGRGGRGVRRLVVTPAMLARVLEKILLDGGFGPPPGQSS